MASAATVAVRWEAAELHVSKGLPRHVVGACDTRALVGVAV